MTKAVETFSSAGKVDHDPHHDVANVLMSMGNPSYQSFGRPQSRAVDVTDLREALGESITPMGHRVYRCIELTYRRKDRPRPLRRTVYCLDDSGEFTAVAR